MGGTCISVITMEGEDCSMENLGVCADLTGGQVDMVDLQTLSMKVGAMLANRILGTGLDVKIILGGGVRISEQAASTGGACVATYAIGNATAKTTLTCGLTLKEATQALALVPGQLQLRY